MHKYTGSAGRGRGSGEVDRGDGTKAPNLRGHLSKIENVNNKTGWVAGDRGWEDFGIQSLKCEPSRMQICVGVREVFKQTEECGSLTFVSYRGCFGISEVSGVC